MIRARNAILLFVLTFVPCFFVYAQNPSDPCDVEYPPPRSSTLQIQWYNVCERNLCTETSCDSYYTTNMTVDDQQALKDCEIRMNACQVTKRQELQQLFNKNLQDNRLSSGIKGAFYTLEWCSPRYIELGWASACKQWYFQLDSQTVKVSWNGADFSVNQDSSLYQVFQQAATQMQVDIATVQQNPSNYIHSIQPIFNALGIDIRGEGAFRIFVYTIDYADNIGKYELYYKIDKTAPKLVWNSITTSSDYIYYSGWVAPLYGTGIRNDSFATDFGNNLEDWWYPVQARSRTDLGNSRNTLYYGRPGEAFYIYLNADDTWGNLITTSWPADYPLGNSISGKVWSLIAWIGSGSDLISEYPSSSILYNQTETFVPGIISTPLVWNGSTSEFTDNPLTQPSTQYYRVRAYDNTVWKNGNKGNYVEYPLYVVLDTTAPNWGSATGVVAFSWGIFWGTSVCDQLLSSITCNYSKFFTASGAEKLEIVLSDIAWGNNQPPYDHFNAWLLTRGNITHWIETSDDPTSSTPHQLDITDAYRSKIDITHNFSKIENDVNTTGWYRYYSGTFTSNFTNAWVMTWVICDRVHNCINIGTLDYRVMAGKVDPIQSTLLISGSSEKMFANGIDTYTIEYSLRDIYGNHIIPVNSQEIPDGTTIEPEGFIRDIRTGFDFRNALRSDMRSWELGSSSKSNVIGFVDKEIDNTPPITNTLTGNTDGTGEYIIHENRIMPRNGVFIYQITSRVPTYDGYPWLLPDQTFSLQGSGLTVKSLIPSTLSDEQAQAAIYDTGSYIWDYAISDASSPDNLISFSWLVENPTDKYNISSDQTAAYGKILGYSGALEWLDGKRLGFGFASPVVWYWDKLDGLIDGTWKQYGYMTFFADPQFTSRFAGYAWYEKYPACEIVPPATVCKDKQEGNNRIVRYQYNTTPWFQSATWVIGYTSGTSILLDEQFFWSQNKVISADPLFANTYSFLRVQVSDARLAFFSLPGKVYDPSKLRVGIVSWLSYKAKSDGLLVQLPGPSRNIFSSTGDFIPNTEGSPLYFHNAYSVWPAIAEQAVRFDTNISDIGIIGYTNTYNAITTGTGTDTATTFLGANISSTLKNTIRKNAAQASRGLSASQWCKNLIGGTFSLNLQQVDGPILAHCVISSNGEKTIFVEGDVNIECNPTGTNICNMNGKKVNVLVKNGITHINSNITTLSATSDDDGRVFIGSFVDGVENTNVDATNITVQKWWIGVDTRVTNLDAFIFTEWSLITTKEWARTDAILNDVDLKNQLYIYGWLFAQDTVGWSRKDPAVCPFTIDPSSCNQEVAQVFDLTFLRRFHLISKQQETWESTDSGTMIPFARGLRAWGVGGADRCIGTSSWTLRCMRTDIYQWVPLIIEKNELWTRDPSLFMKS